MKSLIVYGSQYGSSKRYAEAFSKMAGIPAVRYEDIGDLSDTDLVVHFGGLYAGGVKGLKQTIRAVREGVKLVIVTVGLADVSDRENVENIRRSVARQVPGRMLERAEIFHLRGGIDYARLCFVHRTMMTLLYNRAKRLPEEEKTAEVRAMIETFQSKVDFVDERGLAPILEAVRSYGI